MSVAFVIQRRSSMLLATAAVLVISVGMGILLTTEDGLVVALTAGTAITLVALTRFKLRDTLILLLISQPLISFLKRVIFLMGPQPRMVYYGLHAVPASLMLLAAFLALRQIQWRRAPLSVKALSAYLILAAATTLLALPEVSWAAKLVAILTNILPLTGIYVGLALGMDRCAPVGRILMLLVATSVLYGLAQLLFGPMAVERAWAEGAVGTSIQATKVYAYLFGAVYAGQLPEFRPFSFYPDPLTWGLFLLAAFTMLCSLRLLGQLPKRTAALCACLAACGILITLGRSTALALLITLAAYYLLRIQAFRRPALVLLALVAIFVLIVSAGDWLIENVQGGVFPHLPFPRYFNVTTMGARTEAWNLLKEAASNRWLFGSGYAHSAYLAGRLSGIDVTNTMTAHNFLVDLVLYVGIPGLLLYLGYYLRWLKEGFDAVSRRARSPERNAMLWILAYSIGLTVLGFFSSANFMTFEFFFLAGLLAGLARRVQAVAPQ
jgi:O-antigen ligase